MAKRVLPPSTALYPSPVVLVSCAGADTKRYNAITIAWCGTICSEPPMLSISIRPSRHSYAMIKEAGEFVVNIPSTAIIETVDQCGILSGTKVDKFEKYSLTPVPAAKVSAPLIKECPVNIECVTHSIIPLGTHDMFISKVLCVHVDDGIIKQDGKIDYGRALPFVYNNGEYWNLGSKIGSYGYTGSR